MKRVLVLDLRSLSLTGTTWVNLVLACHPDGLAIGPPDRVWKLGPTDADVACLIHNSRCGFWPGFVRSWDRARNFLLQLHEYSRKRIIVLNNPSKDFTERELTHPDIDHRVILVTRDGRSVLSSFMRHYPDRYETAYEVTRDWLAPALRRIRRQIPSDPSIAMHIRYEDMVRDWQGQLNRVAEFVGVRYPSDAVRFWQFEHHLVAGNTGVIDSLQRLQGLAGFDHRRSEYYQGVVDRLREDPETPVIDESWKQHLSREDLFAYDSVAGDLHELLGYERDRFSADELLAFQETEIKEPTA